MSSDVTQLLVNCSAWSRLLEVPVLIQLAGHCIIDHLQHLPHFSVRNSGIASAWQGSRNYYGKMYSIDAHVLGGYCYSVRQKSARSQNQQVIYQTSTISFIHVKESNFSLKRSCDHVVFDSEGRVFLLGSGC